MDCFGTYFTHVQTCNVTRVQSATQWTASVHTLHMSNLWMLRNVEKKVWIGECIRCIQKKTRFRKTLDWKNTRNRINHCWRRLPREAFETTSYNTNLCNFHIKKIKFGYHCKWQHFRHQSNTWNKKNIVKTTEKDEPIPDVWKKNSENTRAEKRPAGCFTYI